MITETAPFKFTVQIFVNSTVKLQSRFSCERNFSRSSSRHIRDKTETSFNDWYPWLKAANLRNHQSQCCKFLIAELDGTPSSVSLLVNTMDACGIYAVATPPEHRRKGLSSFLLNASEAIAQAGGYKDICLQVHADTYAHRFYEQLGFHEEYRIGIWKRS